MGRELRRVPMDFAWPLKKVWNGFLNPFWEDRCPEEGKTCFNGETAAGKWVNSLTRLISMLGEEASQAPRAEEFRQRDRTFPHPYLEEWSQAPRTEWPRRETMRVRDLPVGPARNQAINDMARLYPPTLLPLTPELEQFVIGLLGRQPDKELFGWNNQNFEIRKRLLALAGCNSETWGICPVCEGEALNPATEEAREAWKETEPPTGPGYQLWETTSEGSPVSPVFETFDLLCDWCADNATTFANNKTTAAEWRRMLDGGQVMHREGNNIFI